MQNHVLDYLNNILVRKPDKLAFANETEGMTFRQVYDQSRAIGTYLNQKSIYKQPVVVFMNKHPKEVTAFFGVITAGDFYVPIDEEMPAGRIQLILDNVQSPLIICDEESLTGKLCCMMKSVTLSLMKSRFRKSMMQQLIQIQFILCLLLVRQVFQRVLLPATDP